jgi:hypothetical protein
MKTAKMKKRKLALRGAATIVKKPAKKEAATKMLASIFVTAAIEQSMQTPAKVSNIILLGSLRVLVRLI